MSSQRKTEKTILAPLLVSISLLFIIAACAGIILYILNDEPSTDKAVLSTNSTTSKEESRFESEILSCFDSTNSEAGVSSEESVNNDSTLDVSEESVNTPVYSFEGEWGQLYWGIDANGVLYIGGDGDMAHLKFGGTDAWLEYKDNINALVIEEGVTSVGNYAFFSAHGIKSVSLPDSLVSIGVNAFRDCQGISEIVLPDGFCDLKEDAFTFCTGLKKVYIPIGVKLIEDWTFGYCYSLEKITYNGTVSQWSSIPKGKNWNLDTPTFKVECIDGIVNYMDMDNTID
ncbi:MAG: leucine-rich repeat domain-containing protein [Clostridia bacterium]|nr:leucine-rich repeat domain-containing protein [Clostridia bacterium]